jgi:hypothetical protein
MFMLSESRTEVLLRGEKVGSIAGGRTASTQRVRYEMKTSKGIGMRPSLGVSNHVRDRTTIRLFTSRSTANTPLR